MSISLRGCVIFMMVFLGMNVILNVALLIRGTSVTFSTLLFSLNIIDNIIPIVIGAFVLAKYNKASL